MKMKNPLHAAFQVSDVLGVRIATVRRYRRLGKVSNMPTGLSPNHVPVFFIGRDVKLTRLCV